ncbi:MAG: hypothetical protein E7046_06960 [Lentisphaerae bacterium]|nr:hypothetical protein [Lentisphaerota bacterium]
MMHAISKEMFCVGVVVASCCATVRVSGANYAFPSVGGDISSAEAWNGILPIGVAIPGEADSIDISQPSDEYKITQDVTFGNIRFTGGSGLFLVDATGRDVNFTTNKNALYTYTSANETGRHITLKGGHWNLNGGEWLGIDSHNTFELRDSCVLTNISTCWATMWSQSSAHLSLKNGSSIFCNEFRVGNKNFSGTVDINDGSKIIVKNNFYTDTGGTVTDVLNCHTTVSGEGSLIEAKNVFLGYKTSGNYIKVCDGATIRCASFLINSSKGNDNRLVLNNAALDVDGFIWLKDGAARGSKSGIAATNSIISVSAFTNSCQSAYLDFQNVQFECNGEFHPFYYGRYGTVRFGGGNGNLPSFMKNPVMLFGTSPIGHTLLIDDGFMWKNGNGAYTKKMMQTTSNCTIRVCNNASLEWSTQFFLGHTDFANQCLDNVVEILDGGDMTASRFYIAGSGNTLVVKNGTLRLTDASEGMGIGYEHSNAKYTPSGAKVVISGTTPKIEAAGNCYLEQDSILKFEIPAQGYAEGYVPFEGLRLLFDNTASIRVDCEDYLAAGGGVLTLMKFKLLPKWDNVEALLAQWLQAQSEAMPLPRCSLKYVVKNDDATHPHHILLRALPPMGLRMVIR